MSIITIATDYGNTDGYTAALIGVLKSMAPESEIIQVTDILEDITKASFSLMRYYSQFPAGTVHLMVVDPTVGTSRRALAGTDGVHFFVGPDNGVFSRLIQNNKSLRWFEIIPSKLPPREISNTFHGRDIFAPAAALISGGTAIEKIGTEIYNPVFLRLPEPEISAGKIVGEIIDVDSFGNLILNILGSEVGNSPKVTVRNEAIPFVMTFADVPEGKPLAYIGSLGLLELAINMGRADEYFKAGSRIVIAL
jgi:S-adenosyl-L-methionine hydrolase (adenosine-forming)